MVEETDDDGGVKTEREAAMVAEFAKLVAEVGGSTKAGKIVGRPRGTIEQWAAGRRRLPFEPVIALVMHLDGNLNRFAIGVGEDVVPPRREVAPVVKGAPLAEGFVTVPVLQVAASAGRGRITVPDDLDDDGELVAFRETWLRSLGLTPGHAHVLWAMGDSMVPTISNGDMLLVDRMIDRVVDDGIYVVVVGGGVVVKRIQLRHNGSVVLKSDNQRYDEQTIPADEVPQLVVEGRVRWVGGPI